MEIGERGHLRSSLLRTQTDRADIALLGRGISRQIARAAISTPNDRNACGLHFHSGGRDALGYALRKEGVLGSREGEVAGGVVVGDVGGGGRWEVACAGSTGGVVAGGVVVGGVGGGSRGHVARAGRSGGVVACAGGTYRPGGRGACSAGGRAVAGRVPVVVPGPEMVVRAVVEGAVVGSVGAGKRG